MQSLKQGNWYIFYSWVLPFHMPMMPALLCAWYGWSLPPFLNTHNHGMGKRGGKPKRTGSHQLACLGFRYAFHTESQSRLQATTGFPIQDCLSTTVRATCKPPYHLPHSHPSLNSRWQLIGLVVNYPQVYISCRSKLPCPCVTALVCSQGGVGP